MSTPEKQDEFGKQIQYVWGLIAESSAIDQERNNISLFNVIDQVNLPRKVFAEEGKQQVGLNHEIIITWRRALNLDIAGEAIAVDCRIALLDPEGEVLEENTNTFQFQTGMRRTRQRVRVNGLHVTNPGDYVYTVEISEAGEDEFRKVNEIPFEVREQ
jgi:hypothetical protein